MTHIGALYELYMYNIYIYINPRGQNIRFCAFCDYIGFLLQGGPETGVGILIVKSTKNELRTLNFELLVVYVYVFYPRELIDI